MRPRDRFPWTEAVDRYLDTLRLLHYSADTLHVRSLYLRYFATWATAQGITTPKRVTRDAPAPGICLDRE